MKDTHYVERLQSVVIRLEQSIGEYGLPQAYKKAHSDGLDQSLYSRLEQSYKDVGWAAIIQSEHGSNFN